MYMRYPLALFAAVLVSCLPLGVQGYYNPGEPSGFVNDFADIIPAAEEVALEETLRSFQAASSNEIAVVTIESLEDDTIEGFAVRLFEDWGIGTAEDDNGILLLIAEQDREMRIEVGYGLEGALTDAQSFAIIDTILKPAFRNEEYGSGTVQAVEAMIAATKGEYEAPVSAAGSMEGIDWEFVLIFGGFFLMWLAAILGRSKSWWAGGVIGMVIAAAIGLFWGFVWFGLLGLVLLVPAGLLFDYIVSREFQAAKTSNRRPPWWGGGTWGPGGGGRAGGGGFGGFGGGMSGGGGASGRW